MTARRIAGTLVAACILVQVLQHIVFVILVLVFVVYAPIAVWLLQTER